ncbi:MAG: tyrosine-type recombinase/integrase, partial [Rubrivivax sp.]
AENRERYLRHCAEQGGARNSLRLKASSILWVAERMSLDDSGHVDASRLGEIVYGSAKPGTLAPATRAKLVGFARLWLKHLGWWHEPTEPIPFASALAGFVDWMRNERGLTPCTIDQWQARTAKFLIWCGDTGRDLATLQPQDIDAYFVTYGAQRWSRISAGHIANMLRVFLRYAATTGACSTALAGSIQGHRKYALETLPYALSWDDVRRVIATASGDSERDVRDRAILLLLAVYGLRREEVAKLRLDQIYRVAGRLHIWRLKRRQPQIYPLVPSVAQALGRYIDHVRPNVTHSEVFIRTLAPRSPISARAIYSVVNKRLRALDIQAAHLGPHALRHSCASKLLADGLTLKEIGDHLGHHSTAATMTYTKIDLASLRQVGDFDLGGLQ